MYEGKWEGGNFGKMKEIVFSQFDQCWGEDFVNMLITWLVYY